MLSDISVVTSYFNPCRYETKKRNFLIFREALREIGAHVVTIEMAVGDCPFELNPGSDILAIRGGSVLWQKERLLNIAISRLPQTIKKVVWCDCDVLFENKGWLEETSAALDRFVVVQPYSECIRLARNELSARCNSDFVESFASVYSRAANLCSSGEFRAHGHSGFGWAARRDFLDSCGLYDASLTGSGDHLMAHLFSRSLDSPCVARILASSDAYFDHFKKWAHEADFQVAGRLGCVSGRLLHLWHGEVSDRRYYHHIEIFGKLGFDPNRHLRLGEGGLWEWTPETNDLQEWARNMLITRREDG